LIKYIGCALLEAMLRRRLAALSRTILAASFLFATGSLMARGQVAVTVNDTVNFRFGVLLQGWADWTQDADTEGYSQNVFLRRIRFILLANVAPGVSVFYQTDDVRLGNAGTNGSKNFNTGLITQDAFIEWKLAGEALMLDGGLFYTPQSRGVLNSSSSNLSFDTPTFAQQQVAFVAGNAGRDYGFGLKGYLVGDHLEYRAGVFSGQRQGTSTQPPPLGPAAGSRNSFRAAGRVQYDFFDVEKGYVYAGTNRGTRKILALGAWGDTQGDFQAYGADIFVDIPVFGKDGITGEADVLSYDGGTQFQQVVGGIVTTLFPKQRAFFADLGYYCDLLKLQPFVRYERLAFDVDAFKRGDQIRYGGGLNWYISGQNLKLSAFYERIEPRVKPATAAIKDTDHFGLQLQAYYF
jgi:hypothetical protein